MFPSFFSKQSSSSTAPAGRETQDEGVEVHRNIFAQLPCVMQMAAFLLREFSLLVRHAGLFCSACGTNALPIIALRPLGYPIDEVSLASRVRHPVTRTPSGSSKFRILWPPPGARPHSPGRGVDPSAR